MTVRPTTSLTIAGLVLIALAVAGEILYYPLDPALDWLDILQESIFLIGGLGALWGAWQAESALLTIGALLLTASLAIDLGDEFILPATLPSQWVPTLLSAAGLGAFALGLSQLALREREGRRKLQTRDREIERYRAQLEVASMKDEFIATMSHELRTPLTAVIGAADTLEQGVGGALTREQREMVGMISGSAEHLLSIINDILELSRLDSGRVTLARESVDVVRCSDAAWALVSGRAQSKRLDATFAVPASAGTISTDGRRLKQMLLNLLDNAVKFTPVGGRVGVEVARDDAAGKVWFTVWDSGPGIAPADQDRLFEPFVQLDAGLNREHQGTGLGLALVRRTARALGGDVMLKSAPGEGSRFTIWLPVTPPPA